MKDVARQYDIIDLGMVRVGERGTKVAAWLPIGGPAWSGRFGRSRQAREGYRIALVDLGQVAVGDLEQGERPGKARDQDRGRVRGPSLYMDKARHGLVLPIDRVAVGACVAQYVAPL